MTNPAYSLPNPFLFSMRSAVLALRYLCLELHLVSFREQGFAELPVHPRVLRSRL